MSESATDSETVAANSRAFDMLLQKQRNNPAKRPDEVLEVVDRVMWQFGKPLRIRIPKRIIHEMQYERYEKQYEHRLQALENKLEWLLDKKIDEQSEGILKLITDEFVQIPFVKEVYANRIPSGYDLVIVHDSEDSDAALSAIVKAKINIRKRLKACVFLELTILRLSDFRREEWADKQLLIKR